MWLIKLAWKNLWRNRSRTSITAAAVAFATIVSILARSLQSGVFENLINNVVSSYTGHMQVHLKGYQEEQVLDNSMRQLPTLESRLSEVAGVDHLTGRMESFALVSFGEKTRGCLVIGIMPGAEEKITMLDRKVSQGSFITPGSRGVLIGKELSSTLGAHAGDTLILIGQGYHGTTAAGKFTVSGILALGSPQLNNRLLVMDLPLAQELFGADSMLTSYVISVNESRSLDRTAGGVRETAGEEYEVLSWEEIMPDVKQHIATDTRNMAVIQWVLYLLVSFGIFSTILIMMVERRFEMGMLLALGMSKLRMQALVIIESILTVITGSLIGMTLSIPVVGYFSRRPIRLRGEAAEAFTRFGFEPVFPASLQTGIFLEQGLNVLIVGLVLSLYPAYVVARLHPVSAMRK